MGEKCYSCEKGLLKKKKVDFKVYGISLGEFEAEVCPKCGESFFDETISDKMDKIAKERGLWGLESRTKIGIAGDGMVIRVNKKIAQFMELNKGKEVILLPESKEKLSIII